MTDNDFPVRAMLKLTTLDQPFFFLEIFILLLPLKLKRNLEENLFYKTDVNSILGIFVKSVFKNIH